MIQANSSWHVVKLLDRNDDSFITADELGDNGERMVRTLGSEYKPAPNATRTAWHISYADLDRFDMNTRAAGHAPTLHSQHLMNHKALEAEDQADAWQRRVALAAAGGGAAMVLGMILLFFCIPIALILLLAGAGALSAVKLIENERVTARKRANEWNEKMQPARDFAKRLVVDAFTDAENQRQRAARPPAPLSLPAPKSNHS